MFYDFIHWTRSFQISYKATIDNFHKLNNLSYDLQFLVKYKTNKLKISAIIELIRAIAKKSHLNEIFWLYQQFFLNKRVKQHTYLDSNISIKGERFQYCDRLMVIFKVYDNCLKVVQLIEFFHPKYRAYGLP